MYWIEVALLGAFIVFAVVFSANQFRKWKLRMGLDQDK
jgi:hypothetical protein